MNPKELAVGSETPLTDAHLEHLNTFDGRKIGIPDSTLYLCRILERELADCRTELERGQICDVCLGESLPSGKKCVCGGTGRLWDTLLGTRLALHEAESRVAPRESEEGLAQRLSKDAYWLEAISADDKYKPADQRDFAETAALLREAADALRSRSGRT